MRELPLTAQVYLSVCYLLGLSALGWLVSSFQGTLTLEDLLLGAALALLAAITQLFVVARAAGHHSDHLTPAPLFAAFLLLPQPLLGLLTFLAFVPEWVWYRRKWFIQTFNISSWLIAAALARWTLIQLTDHSRLERGVPLSAFAIALAMPVFLGTQTLLLALVLKLARGQSLGESGLFSPSKLFVEFALLCSGVAFAAAWVNDPLYGIAAALPLVLIFQALHVPNLKEEASTDPKTGLANMRHFNATFDRDLERAGRSGQPVSLLMCDLDYLRNVNNTYGHQTGDAVLAGVADCIRRCIRGSDVAGRFGGEEFVVLLADTGSTGAQQVAERLRSDVETSRFMVGSGGQAIGVTISIGIATFPTDGRTTDLLLREADLAVYQAKREGRNRVVAAGRASREFAAEWAREHMVPPATAAPSAARPPFWRLIADATRLSVATQAEPVPARKAADNPSGTNGRRNGVGRSSDLSTRVLLFIGLVVVAGLVGLLLRFLPDPQITAVPWGPLGFFAGLTILAEHLAVDVDRRGKTSVSAVAILSASFLYDELGALATVLAFAIWAKIRAGSPSHRMLFNFGNALLAAVLANDAFEILAGGRLDQVSFERAILPAVAAGLTYYAINHALLCVVRGLAEDRRPWQIWVADYQWLWRHYAVLGALGLVVALGYLVFGWIGVLALMAPVGMMHFAIKQYMDRTTIYVEELRRMNARLGDSYEATLLALTRALDTRDEETEEHSQRVKQYAELIARRIAVPEDEVEHMSRGALLHDIGKIGVPDAILLKPGRLSEQEFDLIRRHPSIGYSMIAHIPFLTKAADVVLYHHEAYDGSGYPSGLRGETIPLGARIFAIADAFDAMTSDRPYRSALTAAVARAEIERCRGRQFDPTIVDAFLAISAEELSAVRKGADAARERQGILFQEALGSVVA